MGDVEGRQGADDPFQVLQQHVSGGSQTITTGTAWRNDYGVGMTGAIGFNLSARSGYTNRVSLKFDNVQWKTRLCGTNDVPGKAARMVVRSAG